MMLFTCNFEQLVLVEIAETLRLLEAYQFTAKHGEVCPAGWNSGDDSMKPDVEGSKEWLEKTLSNFTLK